MAKAKDPLVTQAERDTRIALRPQRQALKRARRAGTQDYKTAEQRVQQVTSALLGQLGQIPGAYQGQVAGIMPNLTSSIGSLGSMLNSDLGQVPQAEQAAGAANIGAIGAGTLEQLASGQQNMANYIASSKNQGAVQGAVTAQNYAKDYANFMKQNRQQVVDVTSQAHDLILQRLDQLKQEKFDRTMALKQLGMQQSQIDQQNRALDAQIAFETARAKWLRHHSRTNRTNPDPAIAPTSRPQNVIEPPPMGAETGPVPASHWQGVNPAGLSQQDLGAYLTKLYQQGVSEDVLLKMAQEWDAVQPGPMGQVVIDWITQLIANIKAVGGANG